jgi:hypothetical protein
LALPSPTRGLKPPPRSRRNKERFNDSSRVKEANYETEGSNSSPPDNNLLKLPNRFKPG